MWYVCVPKKRRNDFTPLPPPWSERPILDGLLGRVFVRRICRWLWAWLSRRNGKFWHIVSELTAVVSLSLVGTHPFERGAAKAEAIQLYQTKYLASFPVLFLLAPNGQATTRTISRYIFLEPDSISVRPARHSTTQPTTHPPSSLLLILLYISCPLLSF